MQHILRTVTLSEREPSSVRNGGAGYSGTYGDQLSVLVDDELPPAERYGYCLHGVADARGVDLEPGAGYYEGEDVFGFGDEAAAESAGRGAYGATP
jgi:hypothetical protein